MSTAPRRGDPEPLEPKPLPSDEPHLVFARGRRYPRAIAWFGLRSFYGHLWHLAASAVATQDIDARDWMCPQPPDALTARIAEALGRHDEPEDDGQAPSLAERLGGDLWIDYLADTGDDSSVSAAVADMVFRRYRVAEEGGGHGDLQSEGEAGEDGERGGKVLPRGHLLVFGGDTAYPVATDVEIHNRVSVPFNRVLKSRMDGCPRVLLGIPGNHDWYDGLDGFARMFRARQGSVDRASTYDDDRLEPGQIHRLIEWVEAFRAGEFVAKRPTLPLYGYTPVQSASYFCLRLAPNLDLWAVDRQLRAVDYGQQSYFLGDRARRPDHGLMLLLPDPAFQMLEPYDVGQRTLASLDVELEEDGALVMSGDTHHYCRQSFGEAVHVTAGGGGAFLHPARIPRWGVRSPEAEFPGPRACFALAMQVPWQIAGGRAGFLVHLAAALLYLPLAVSAWLGEPSWIGPLLVGVIAWVASATLAGWRQRHPLRIGALAALLGAWVAALPWLCGQLLERLVGDHLGRLGHVLATHALAVYPAALGFGTYLMVLTLVGLEQLHAFSALAHPGYKHFVRLRVRRDGSGIDAWVLGKVDTLRPESEIVLVDRWSWNNPAHPQAQPSATPSAATAAQEEHGDPG